MIPDSEEQKKLMQERLEYFRARLETMTDSDFDAIMIKLGLSTARTPPTNQNQQDQQPQPDDATPEADLTS